MKAPLILTCLLVASCTYTQMPTQYGMAKRVEFGTNRNILTNTSGTGKAHINPLSGFPFGLGKDPTAIVVNPATGQPMAVSAADKQRYVQQIQAVGNPDTPYFEMRVGDAYWAERGTQDQTTAINEISNGVVNVVYIKALAGVWSNLIDETGKVLNRWIYTAN